VAIIQDEVNLYKSVNQTDTPSGGGRMGSTMVNCGAMNNLFGDITRMDRLTGRVQLRKVWMRIDDDTDDMYGGSHVCLSIMPDDPSVSIIMFDTDDWDDLRSDIKTRIEAYTVDSGVSAGTATTLYPITPNALVFTVKIKEVDIYQSYIEYGEAAYSHIVQQWEGTSTSWTFDVNVGDTIKIGGATPEYVQVKRIEDMTETNINEHNQQRNSTYRNVFVVSAFQLNHIAGLTFTKTKPDVAWRCYGTVPLGTNVVIGDVVLPVVSTKTRVCPVIEGFSEIEEYNPLPVSQLVPYEYVPELHTNVYGIVRSYFSEWIPVVKNQIVYVYQVEFPGITTNSCVISVRNNKNWYEIRDNGFGVLIGNGSGTVDYDEGIVTIVIPPELAPDDNTHIFVKYKTTVGFEEVNDVVCGPLQDYTIPIDLSGTKIVPGTILLELTTSYGVFRIRDNGVGGLSSDRNLFTSASPYYSADMVTVSNQMFRSNEYYYQYLYSAGTFYEYTSTDGVSPWEGTLVSAAGGTGGYLPLNQFAYSICDNGTWQIGLQVLGLAYIGSGGDTAKKLYYRDGVSVGPYWNECTWSGSGDATVDVVSVCHVEETGLQNDVGLAFMSYVAFARTKTDCFWHSTNGTTFALLPLPALQMNVSFVTFIKAHDETNDTYYGAFMLSNATGSVIKFLFRNNIGNIVLSSSVPAPLGGNITALDGRTGNNYAWASYYTGPTGNGAIARCGITARIAPANPNFPLFHSYWVNFQPRLTPVPTASGRGMGVACDKNGHICYASGWGHATLLHNYYFSADGGNTWYCIQATDRIYLTANQVAYNPNTNPPTFVGAIFHSGSIERGSVSFNIISYPFEQVGTIDYDTGIGELTDGYPLTESPVARFYYKQRSSKKIGILLSGVRELQVNSLEVWALKEGATETVTISEVGGVIVGDGTMTINHEAAYALVEFDDDLTLDTIKCKFGSLTFTRVNDLELDGDRFPIDGMVPAFYPNDVVVVRDGTNADMGVVMAVTDDNIVIANPLSHDFLASNTIITNAVVKGDLQATYNTFFTQQSWDGTTWSDTQSGPPADGAYTEAGNIIMVDRGSEKTRWVVIVTNVIVDLDYVIDVESEDHGIVVSGISAGTGHGATIVNNPNFTGPDGPYLTINEAFWGAGWQTGNIIRFNTEEAGAPFWIARVINAESSGVTADSTTVEIRGDI